MVLYTRSSRFISNLDRLKVAYEVAAHENSKTTGNLLYLLYWEHFCMGFFSIRKVNLHFHNQYKISHLKRFQAEDIVQISEP